ncbi:hypothetical protein BGW80DRAFT_1310958 [Lactifluus volemus]|nr:hypothetical protein BGW80DRAFT_1310958 [Lactifluus volemus]
MDFSNPSPDPIFNAPDADIICVLMIHNQSTSKSTMHPSPGSPFFQTMFSLPQPKSTTTDELIPVLDVAESSAVFDPLLRFLYPVQDPEVTTLDALVPLLCAAANAPLRVFAIASRFDMEEEAKMASKHTLRMRVLDAPLSDDLRHISAYSYHQLLQLHQRRGEAALQALCVSKGLRCLQCNGTNPNAVAPPKWWGEFVTRAEEELRIRPTTEIIFSPKFLMQCALATGCPRCSGSILESFIFLDALKEKIDALPSTI